MGDIHHRVSTHLRHAAAILAACALTLSLNACDSVPPLNFSVPNVGPSLNKLGAELKTITITPARPDEKTGEVPLGIDAMLPTWKEAILEALNRMVIFKDDAAKKVSLSVKVLSFEFPKSKIETISRSTARYELIDRETGGIIFTTDISSEGIATLGFSVSGAARGNDSVNRNVQNNIALFLQALETVDINKPMFPVAATEAHPKKDAK